MEKQALTFVVDENDSGHNICGRSLLRGSSFSREAREAPFWDLKEKDTGTTEGKKPGSIVQWVQKIQVENHCLCFRGNPKKARMSTGS